MFSLRETLNHSFRGGAILYFHLAALSDVVRLGCWKEYGGKGLGTVADILFGITGAMTACFLLDALGIPGEDIHPFLLSLSGAATLPVSVRLWVGHRDRPSLPRKLGLL